MKKYFVGTMAAMMAIALVSFTTVKKHQKIVDELGYFHFIGSPSDDRDDDLSKWSFVSYEDAGEYACAGSGAICTMKAPVTGEQGQEVIDGAALGSPANILTNSNVTDRTYEEE